MDKYAPKLSKVLMTPDPHYIPGYTGHCPQMKFNMGKTYGQLTSELLTSPDVKHSSCLVLRRGHVPSPSDAADAAALSPTDAHDSNLRKMIPGYTGFIPRSRNYFSCSYSETCRKALTEFYQEGRAQTRRQSADLPFVVNRNNQQFEARKPKPPQTALPNKMIPYRHTKSFNSLGSPYFMEDDNPHKYFVSGFTGHVPRSRFLIGKSYPIITNQALIQFGNQQSDLTYQDVAERKDSTVPPMPTISPSHRGVVPSFTGHIPGYKFSYGHTFGQLSHNALEKWHQRNLQEKS